MCVCVCIQTHTHILHNIERDTGLAKEIIIIGTSLGTAYHRFFSPAPSGPHSDLTPFNSTSKFSEALLLCANNQASHTNVGTNHNI